MVAKGAGFQPIPGIAPVRGSVSLLSVARTLPVGYDGWRSGVTWRQTFACDDSGDGPAFREAFCDDTDLEFQSGTNTKPQFYPYRIYVPWECDWITPADVENGQEADFRAEAQLTMDAVTAYHVSNELLTGTIEADNPSLISVATDVSAGSPVHPITAVGLLLEAWMSCTQQAGDGRRGPVIHAPYGAITSLLAHDVIAQAGDVYHGPGGSLVSCGPGYPVGNTATPDDGSDGADLWLYITGPVEYGLTPPVLALDQEEARVNPRMNQYEVFGHRWAIHRFDPCCVFACGAYRPIPTATTNV